MSAIEGVVAYQGWSLRGVPLYSDAISMVKINSEISSSFPCTKGVRQGCNRSPLLFSLYIADLEKYLYAAGSEGAELLDSKLCILMFTDDIVLIAHSPEDLQNSLNTCKLLRCLGFTSEPEKN